MISSFHSDDVPISSLLAESENIFDDKSLERRRPSSWKNPKSDRPYSLIIIGAGAVGLTAAYEAAAKGIRVAIIEKDMLGGECLNIACIPSKAIIRTSRLYADMRNAKNFGAIIPDNIRVDFQLLMERIRKIRMQASGRACTQRLKHAGIDIYFGNAAFINRQEIAVGDQTIRFKKALIASGSRPLIVDIPGLEETGYLTNKTIFNLKNCPPSLGIIGGGATGCELAQAYCRLGVKVTIIQDNPMFLDNIERDGAQILSDALAKDGVEIHLNSTVVNVRKEGAKKLIELVSDDNKYTISVDEILVSTGRLPVTEELGLEKAGVDFDKENGILVNDFVQTSNPNIYAAGDVSTDLKYVHIQDGLARLAVHNAFSFFGRERKSNLIAPWCIYTDPEIAHIGLHAKEAREAKIPIKTFTILMHQVDRAIADSETSGFVKVNVREGTGQILGATIVARHAGDIINDISLAMTKKINLGELAEPNYPYPTQGDAIKLVAAAYLRSLSYTSNLKLFLHDIIGKIRLIIKL